MDILESFEAHVEERAHAAHTGTTQHPPPETLTSRRYFQYLRVHAHEETGGGEREVGGRRGGGAVDVSESNG
jgi:hypothetical protein